MRKKLNILDGIVVGIVVVVVAIIFITAKKSAVPLASPPIASQAAKVVSLYYSAAMPTKYCDGANMDTAGYAKTINKKLDLPVPQTATTPAAQFLFVMNAGVAKIGATYSCPDFFLRDLQAKFVGKTAYLFSPGGGWAGVSIAMCTCTPFLENNLSQSFGMTTTTWVNTQAEFDAAK